MEEAEAEELAFFPGEEPSARSLALKKIRSAAAKANDGVGEKHMESKHMNYTAGAGDVDFDDGLLPEEEEEDVEMLSDDKVFQALNEDLSAM